MRRITVLLTLALSGLLSSSALAQDRHLVVDGLLKDSTDQLLNGSYDITFSLYADQVSETAIWTETIAGQPVNNGLMQARLGTSNTLPAQIFNASNLWLGIALAGQPEFPRTPLETDPYAFHAMTATVAAGLQCSGCLNQSHIGLSLASADSDGNALNAITADTAVGLSCTGCVTVEALAVDLSQAANIAFDDTTAQLGADNVQGAIEALKVQLDAGGGNGGSGGSGDGTLPPDALGAISNGLLKNVFTEQFSGVSKAIPDNNPGGVLDEVAVPDVGIVQEISVSIDVTNADVSGLVITLFDPLNNQYILHDKTGQGAYIAATYPVPTATVSGDLNSWVGQNAAGTWRLIVADWQDNGGGSDGQINSWSVNIQYLSSKKIVLKGDLVADGQVLTDGGKSNCFIKDIGDGFSALYCGDTPISGFKAPESPLMRKAFAGGSTSCGILLDKSAMCWGSWFTNQNSPPVLDGEYDRFGLGDSGGCGLRTDGTLNCWGNHGVNNSPSGTFVDVSCNTNACCAVRDDESMECWGKSDYNQLDSPLGNYVQVDGGRHHFCALTIAGDVKCWGRNSENQTDVPQTNDVYVQVSLQPYKSCALRGTDGYVRCWGDSAPGTNGPIRELSGGSNDVHCGRAPGGRYECWGTSSYYQSINSTGSNSSSGENAYRAYRRQHGPFISIEASYNDHVCGVRNDLTITCWGGNNGSGQLNPPTL